jgi:hypothetical protein
LIFDYPQIGGHYLFCSLFLVGLQDVIFFWQAGSNTATYTHLIDQLRNILNVIPSCLYLTSKVDFYKLNLQPANRYLWEIKKIETIKDWHFARPD